MKRNLRKNANLLAKQKEQDPLAYQQRLLPQVMVLGSIIQTTNIASYKGAKSILILFCLKNKI